jgi:hypothetical protein
MNVRRRTMNKSAGDVGSAPANAITKRQPAVTQAAHIRNAVSTPKAVGYGKVKNAVNG